MDVHATEQVSTVKEEKHPSLYNDDGDIELAALTADGMTKQLFNVYRVMLGRTSDVFQDMLDVGDASNGPRAEVVQMPDNAEDLSALLKCIHDGT